MSDLLVPELGMRKRSRPDPIHAASPPASKEPRHANARPTPHDAAVLRGRRLALWKEYRRTNDRALRDRLVLTFAPLVKYIVYKKVREMPARCEVEDFISCGLEALIQSIERYDPAKGATLEQYAWTRIHGAVLDELRRQDWAPRSVRRWERDIERAADEFTVAARPPADARRARRVRMGITVDELRKPPRRDHARPT